jgi:hypothetical protein
MAFGEQRKRFAVISNFIVIIPANAVQLQHQKLENKFGRSGGVPKRILTSVFGLQVWYSAKLA